MTWRELGGGGHNALCNTHPVNIQKWSQNHQNSEVPFRGKFPGKIKDPRGWRPRSSSGNPTSWRRILLPQQSLKSSSGTAWRSSGSDVVLVLLTKAPSPGED